MNKNLLLAIITVPIVAVIVWVVVSSNQNGSSTPDINDKTSNELNQEESGSCKNIVKVSNALIEKDPAGDTEAWVRFDYTSSESDDLICAYTITIKNSQNELVREIKTEDTFVSPNGVISNGYSSTPYIEGMTVVIKLE